MTLQTDNVSYRLHRIYILLVFLQGLVVAVWLAIIPGDSKNVLVFGLSFNRLVLILIALMLGGSAGFVGFRALKEPAWFEMQANRVERWLLVERRWGKALLLAAGTVIISGLALLIVEQGGFYVLSPPPLRGGATEVEPYYVDLAFRKLQLYMVRLQPLFTLSLGIALQSLLLLPVICFGWKPLVDRLRSGRAPFFVGVYGVFLAIWGLLGGSRLQLSQDVLGWNAQTSPVTDVHLILAVILGIGIYLLARRIDIPGQKIQRVDAAVFIVLWVCAIFYWQSIPFESNWYLSAPRAPNFEFYPNSDALVYDRTAVSLASGAGLKTYTNPTVVRRPMYTFFLGVLHVLADGDYEAVLLIQSALLGIFPALAYLLTKDLHNRFAGVMLALLLILREAAALGLAGHITLSHSRLTMSDFPMAFGVILFTLLAFRALEKHPGSWVYPLSAGGVVGVFTLVRMEVSLLILVTLAVGFIHRRKAYRQFFLQAGLMAAGVVLILSPWLIRNWQRTGRFYLEVPGNRSGFLFNRLLETPEDGPPAGPEEDLPAFEEGFILPGDPGARAALTSAGVQLRPVMSVGGRGAATQDRQDTMGFLSLIWNHYLHSNVQMVLAIPMAFRGLDAAAGYTQHQSPDRFFGACCESLDYIRRFTYWDWYAWQGELPIQSWVLIAGSLLLLSIGIGSAWLAHSWAGLLPLLFSQAMVFILAVARTSGGRYLLPVDWVFLMYYAIGLARLLEWGLRLAFRDARANWLTQISREKYEHPGTLKLAAAVGLGLLLLGISLPLSEQVISKHDPETELQSELARIESMTADPEIWAVLSSILEGGGRVHIGQAQYPRYYGPGEGEPGGAQGFLVSRPYDRLSFLLIGTRIEGVVMALDGFSSVKIPNGAEVVVAGCSAENFLDTAVVFLVDSGEAILRSPLPESPGCPLSIGE